MGAWKRLRYRVLRRVPGPIGVRYAERYDAKFAGFRFREVLAETSGMLAVDLGANIGEYSLLLARRAARVYAFEPDPWAIAQLRRNTSHLDNVEIIEAAAGCTPGRTRLFRHPDFDDDPVINSQSSSVIPTKSNITQDGFFEVDQVDLIQFIRDLDGPVGILKIDIEGAEVDLLEALLDQPDVLARIGFIFAETHETKISGHGARIEALRERAKRIKKPEINLNWH